MSRRGKRLLQAAEGRDANCSSSPSTDQLKRQRGREDQEEEESAKEEERKKEDEEEKVRSAAAENFKCVHFALNSFAQRRQVADVGSVLEVVRKMTGRCFSKADLCIILGVCDALSVQRVNNDEKDIVDWRHLLLRVNYVWPPIASSNSHTVEAPSPSSLPSRDIRRLHMPIQSKIVYFKDLLKSVDFSSSQAKGEEILRSFVKPVDHTTAKIRQKNRSGADFKDIIRNELHSNQKMTSKVLSIDIGQTAIGIENLKQDVVERHRVAENRKIESSTLQIELTRLEELSHLPRLGDSLRSLALTQNLTCYSLSNLVTALSNESNSAFLRDKPHLNSALRCLAGFAPEFVQIFPPDEYMPYESLRINLRAPYKSVRVKLKEAAGTANEKKARLVLQS